MSSQLCKPTTNQLHLYSNPIELKLKRFSLKSLHRFTMIVTHGAAAAAYQFERCVCFSATFMQSSRLGINPTAPIIAHFRFVHTHFFRILKLVFDKEK